MIRGNSVKTNVIVHSKSDPFNVGVNLSVEGVFVHAVSCAAARYM